MRQWLGVAAAAIIVTVGGCMSDRGADSDTPFEAERYPTLQKYLDSACAQFCTAFGVALAARYETDTSALPGLDWPFEMPPRKRSNATNFPDSNTSWFVGYNELIDTTRFAAVWDLGRIVDTGVLDFSSPIVATRIEHWINYVLVEELGDDPSQWGATLDVSLGHLDDDEGTLEAGLQATHRVRAHCSKRPCDSLKITITEGQFGKTGGELSTSTLSGVISGTVKFTEFDVLLGHDATYIWNLVGTITDGAATITATSAEFSETSSYSLCP